MIVYTERTFEGSYESSLAGKWPKVKIGKHLSQYMRFPTMWHFDIGILGRASAASF